MLVRKYGASQIDCLHCMFYIFKALFIATHLTGALIDEDEAFPIIPVFSTSSVKNNLAKKFNLI